MPANNNSESTRSTDRWDNEGGMMGPEMSTPDHLKAELKHHGIASVQLTVFDWGGYRYSNARDAIAAAKRASR